MRTIATVLVVALLGFTGGTTANQWLAANGTSSLPSYSYASETDMGLYRRGAGEICTANASDLDANLCFENGQLQVSSDGTQVGAVTLNNSASNYHAWYYQDGASDYNMVCAESTTLDFGIGTYAGDFALMPACVYPATTYLQRYSASGGNLILLTNTGAAATGSLGWRYGSAANTLSIGDKLYSGATSAYIMQTATDELTYYVANTAVAMTRLKDLIEMKAGMYLRTYSSNSSLLSTQCDATTEHGRFVVDYGANKLYVCNFDGGSTWMYIDLVE